MQTSDPRCFFPVPPSGPKALLDISWRYSQANLSISPSTLRIIYFHLLAIFCACTHLKVLGVLSLTLPRDSSFLSEPYKLIAFVRPPSRSRWTSKRSCVVWNCKCLIVHFSLLHCSTSSSSGTEGLGSSRCHRLLTITLGISSMVVLSASSSSCQAALLPFPCFFHRLLGESFQEFQSPPEFQELLHQDEDQLGLLLPVSIRLWDLASLNVSLLAAPCSKRPLLVSSSALLLLAMHEVSSASS